jgi:mannosyltransferase
VPHVRDRAGSAAADRVRAWVAPLAVAGIAVVLDAIDLSRRSYWIDEAFNVLLVREPWGTFVRTIVDREPSQAVYLLFLKPYVAVVGDGEFATRLPSLIAGAAAAALLVDTGRRLFGLRVGVVGGVLFAVDGRFVEWSQYARTYALATLAAVATTALFVRACRRGDARSFLAYGIAGAVSIYCHFYAGFVLVGHAAAFFAYKPRLPTRRLVEAWAVIGLGLVPFGVYLVRGTRSPVEWIPPLSTHELWQATSFASGANAGILFAAALGSIFLARFGRERAFAPLLATGWFVAPLACGLIVSLVKPALVPRFLIVASPALALLAAFAVDRLARLSTALGALVAVVLVALSFPVLLHTYRQNPEDWRAAARAARDARRHGSTVAVLPDFGWRALAIYAPDVGRVTIPSGKSMTVLVSASPSARRELVSSFVGKAPYRLVRAETIGPDFVAEVWARR